MTYEIIDNMELPKATRTVLRAPKYPFATMTEGQGFKEPVTADETPAKVSARLLSAVYSFRKAAGANAPRFQVQQITEPDGTIVIAVRCRGVVADAVDAAETTEPEVVETTSPQEYY